MATETSYFKLTGILRDTLDATIYGNSAYSCLDVLNHALELLFVKNGRKGLCANGELLTAGRIIVDWNGGVRSGFTDSQMKKMLTGDFSQVTPFNAQHQFTIENPHPPRDAGAWGSARV